MSIYNSYVVPPPAFGSGAHLHGSHIVRTVPTVTVPTVQPRIASPVVVHSGVHAPVVTTHPAVAADNAYFTNAIKAVLMIFTTLGLLWSQWASLSALYALGTFGSFKIF